jgi:hypothetical protein
MSSARGRWKWLIFLTLLACNLTRALPTPTPPPTLPPTPPPLEDEFQPSLTEESVNPDCPATPPGWIPYTVEPRDSMGLLAEQTSSTIQELVAGNCLDNADQIFVGQVLYLPRQPVISP